MAFGVIATIQVQEGKNADFEAVFKELAAQVLEKEEGCLFYSLHRSQTDPQEYKVLEQYASMQDIEVHRTMPHFQQANVQLAPLVSGPPKIELLDTV